MVARLDERESLNVLNLTSKPWVVVLSRDSSFDHSLPMVWEPVVHDVKEPVPFLAFRAPDLTNTLLPTAVERRYKSIGKKPARLSNCPVKLDSWVSWKFGFGKVRVDQRVYECVKANLHVEGQSARTIPVVAFKRRPCDCS
jgi:hypothetical protein